MPPFPIGAVTAFAIWIICWWMVLFCVLPLGMHQGERDRPTDGGDWGAPADPQLKRKFVTTTWVSFLIWLVVLLILWLGLIPLPALPGGPS